MPMKLLVKFSPKVSEGTVKVWTARKKLKVRLYYLRKLFKSSVVKNSVDRNMMTNEEGIEIIIIMNHV